MFRNARCGAAVSDTANTVSYYDLRSVLEAGYWASLETGYREPIHFAVVKSYCGKRAVETFTAPFMESWHRRFPNLTPTLMVLGINRAAAARGQDLPTHCARVLGRMTEAAVGSGLAVLDRLEQASLAAAGPPVPDLNYELSMPTCFTPFGVLGVAHTRHHVGT